MPFSVELQMREARFIFDCARNSEIYFFSCTRAITEEVHRRMHDLQQRRNKEQKAREEQEAQRRHWEEVEIPRRMAEAKAAYDAFAQELLHVWKPKQLSSSTATSGSNVAAKTTAAAVAAGSLPNPFRRRLESPALLEAEEEKGEAPRSEEELRKTKFAGAAGQRVQQALKHFSRTGRLLSSSSSSSSSSAATPASTSAGGSVAELVKQRTQQRQLTDRGESVEHRSVATTLPATTPMSMQELFAVHAADIASLKKQQFELFAKTLRQHRQQYPLSSSAEMASPAGSDQGHALSRLLARQAGHGEQCDGICCSQRCPISMTTLISGPDS